MLSRLLCLQHLEGMTPEIRSLKEGEYVGVRRFTRILERGTEAKADLDKVIDRCGSLVNLRTAIMRYRKPRRWFRFYRCAPLPLQGVLCAVKSMHSQAQDLHKLVSCMADMFKVQVTPKF